MQIRVHANQSIHGPGSLEPWVQQALEPALGRFAPDITALEVHLSDVNASRVTADHKRCTIEARVRGREPVAVRHQAERLDEALQGACDKLRRALERELGRLRDPEHRQRASIRHGNDPGGGA